MHKREMVHSSQFRRSFPDRQLCLRWRELPASVRLIASGSQSSRFLGRFRSVLVRCPGHNVTDSDPSDDYETESTGGDHG